MTPATPERRNFLDNFPAVGHPKSYRLCCGLKEVPISYQFLDLRIIVIFADFPTTTSLTSRSQAGFKCERFLSMITNFSQLTKFSAEPARVKYLLVFRKK